MNEMVERVALAIAEAARAKHGGTMMAWATSPEREDCRAFAVAAIQAMRKPTKAMADEGDDAAGSLAITGDSSAVYTWELMIDAALQ